MPEPGRISKRKNKAEDSSDLKLCPFPRCASRARMSHVLCHTRCHTLRRSIKLNLAVPLHPFAHVHFLHPRLATGFFRVACRHPLRSPLCRAYRLASGIGTGGAAHEIADFDLPWSWRNAVNGYAQNLRPSPLPSFDHPLPLIERLPDPLARHRHFPPDRIGDNMPLARPAYLLARRLAVAESFLPSHDDASCLRFRPISG